MDWSTFFFWLNGRNCHAQIQNTYSFFLLFFTFLKMVLSSVFNFISDFCMYKFFSLLQFRGILRSLKSASHSSHPVRVFVLCFLAANRAHNASKELKEAHCAAVLSTKPAKESLKGESPYVLWITLQSLDFLHTANLSHISVTFQLIQLC